MRLLPRAAALAAACCALAAGQLAEPPRAEASVACDAGGKVAEGISGGVEAITGGLIGAGNPLDDVCDTVSEGLGGAVTKPLGGALKGLGDGVFRRITAWVSEGAGWLIGKVLAAIEQTTTPRLTAKAFVSTYAKMAAIAALLGMAMLLLAVLEGIAQGNVALLARVALVNVPLAFIATGVAYLIVQLGLAATDGLCDFVSRAGGHDAERFFAAAVARLGEAGGEAGEIVGGGAAGKAAGSATVPLFVAFLAAIVGACAAFMVWLELLMRDAAVYVVALFTPLALAASIWPRWSGALRRTAELLAVIVGSKFVIVSILALAAGLLAEPSGRVEGILAAAALLLLACFAPFVLLKLVPFAEGAIGAAYARRSASGGAVSGLQIASDARILRSMARSNWGGEEGGDGVTLWSAGEATGASQGQGPTGGAGGSGPAAAGAGPRQSGGASPGSSPAGGTRAGAAQAAGSGAGAGGGAAAGAAPAAGGAAGGATAVPAAATAAARTGTRQLALRSVAQQASQAGARPAAASEARGGSEMGEGRPASTGAGKAESPSEPAERPPRPAPERPGAKPEKGGER